MTEDEAKTRLCCGPRNRGPSRTEDEPLCIGSACMAWRAVHTHYTVGHQSPTRPDGDGWMRDLTFPDRWIRQNTNTTGYCGLAGRPE